MRVIPVIFTIVLAIVAGVYGWLAASAWATASTAIKHHWGMESPDTDWAHEAKISATMLAVSESAILNRKAADLTKWAVVFGASASVLGALTGLF